jgi:hypothetical protein
LAHLDPTSGFDGGNVTQNFKGDDINNVVQNQIGNGPLPESDMPAHTPIYVVVTPPNTFSDYGYTSYGFNHLNHDTHINFRSVDYDDFPEIWVWSGNNSDGTAKVDQFSWAFSYVVAEIMSDLGGGGFEVNPGANWPGGGSGHQIGDNEPNSYSFRQNNGTVVRPYWSARDWASIVPDGFSQEVISFQPNWNRNTFTNTYHLTIKSSGGGGEPPLVGAQQQCESPFGPADRAICPAIV